MLEHEMIEEKGVLVAQPKGPLTKDDFAALASDADAYIEAHGGLNGLMIRADAFPGWENLDGALSHFRFVRDHHRNIGKVAFVSDSDVLSLLPKIGRHFVSAEVRHFPADREAEAMEWLAA